MFDPDSRETISELIVGLAIDDPRVTAGAVVGSLAVTPGDRFSDLDLSFGIAEGVDVRPVLDAWTAQLTEQHGAETLFDLAVGSTVFRVLLLPGALEVDLSVTPAASFGRRSETFRLLFGEEAAMSSPTPRPLRDMVGHAVHHVLHARTSIERRRWVQAVYWIGELRNEVVQIATVGVDGDPAQARGAHLISGAVATEIGRTLPRSMKGDELRRSLSEAVTLLRLVTADTGVLSDATIGQLEELAATPRC